MIDTEVKASCEVCGKSKNCCSITCFEDNEANIFKNLTNQELDFLIDEKQQIHYNPGETIIKQNTSSTFVVCIREGYSKVYV